MKLSDFDEVNRLTLQRERIQEALSQLSKFKNLACSIDALCFGGLSKAGKIENCIIDLQKIEIDPSDVHSQLLERVQTALQEYLDWELKGINLQLVALDVEITNDLASPGTGEDVSK